MLTVLKQDKKSTSDDVRQTTYYETQSKRSRTKLSKSNYPSNKAWVVSTQITHMFIFSESLSASLGGQMRKEQIKTGILELIAKRKSLTDSMALLLEL